MKLAIMMSTAVVTLVACTPTREPAPTTDATTQNLVVLTPEQYQRAGIVVASAETTMVATSIVARGYVAVPPSDMMRIPAMLGGTVQRVNVMPAASVRKGTVIATLEGAQFITLQRDYLTTTVELDLAEQQAKRQQRLAGDSIVARKVLDESMATLASLRIRKRALAEQLALCGIDVATLSEQSLARVVAVRAPYDGVITNVRATPGTTLNPGDALVEMVSPQNAFIELSIFERDAGAVVEGAAVRFRLASAEAREYTGRVIAKGVDVGADRTIKLRVQPDENHRALVPGATVTATVQGQAVPRLTVPTSAVLRTTDGSQVALRVGERTFRWAAAQVGDTTAGRVAVMIHDSCSPCNVVVQGHRALMAEGE